MTESEFLNGHRKAWRLARIMTIALALSLLVFLGGYALIGAMSGGAHGSSKASRELIDDISRAEGQRLEILARETLPFSVEEKGDFALHTIEAGVDCAWVLDPGGKIEKGTSIHPENSSDRPHSFQWGSTEGVLVRPLFDGIELWKVNDRMCLALRVPIFNHRNHDGDFVVAQYTAKDYAERYALLEAQEAAEEGQARRTSSLKWILCGASVLLWATLTLRGLYLEGSASK